MSVDIINTLQSECFAAFARHWNIKPCLLFIVIFGWEHFIFHFVSNPPHPKTAQHIHAHKCTHTCTQLHSINTNWCARHAHKHENCAQLYEKLTDTSGQFTFIISILIQWIKQNRVNRHTMHASFVPHAFKKVAKIFFNQVFLSR